MKRALAAGAVYFLLVFGIGFVLGMVRVLWLEPGHGKLRIVLVEVPVILAASWFLCRWLIRRLRVPATLAARLVMGLVAFGLVVCADWAVAHWMLGASLAGHLRSMATPANAIGLAGQVVYGAFPLLQLRKSGSESRDRVRHSVP